MMNANSLSKSLVINDTKVDKTKCPHCPYYKILCRYRNNVLEKNCLSYFKKKYHNRTDVTIFNNDRSGNYGFLMNLPTWNTFPKYTTAMLQSPTIGKMIKIWIKTYPNVLIHVKSIDGVTEIY